MNESICSQEYALWGQSVEPRGRKGKRTHKDENKRVGAWMDGHNQLLFCVGENEDMVRRSRNEIGEILLSSQTKVLWLYAVIFPSYPSLLDVCLYRKQSFLSTLS
ncbi:unnamed protein product [Linum tenue]|uniref:Uncharacterized protein n=1 Tax=Linum tenue TaxID=586396 RepID=A0AAV0JR25_9ROSI|nr:unnamed protein product [Linum tenue]